MVECDFHYAGCEVRLPRRNMPDHLKDGLVAHVSLLAVSHKQQQEAYQREIQALNKTHQEEIKALERRQGEEMKAMRGEINELKKHMRIIPLDFVVENPNYRYVTNNLWSSTPFYSHNQGYKLQIFYYNVKVLGAYIRCVLMQGEFDHLLKWPLKAVMKLSLLSQQPQGCDREFSVRLECSKPSGDETVRCGSHSIGSIIDPYIHRRCLHIRLISVQF